jgi:phenylalanyl-tRNA synthetase beta chain
MPQAWSLMPDAYAADFYYAKGIVEDLLASLGIVGTAFAPGTHPITHPGRTATVSVNGHMLGIVAELNEPTVETQDLPRRTYVFDLDGDVLRSLASDTRIKYTPLPKFPAVFRDLAPVFSLDAPYTAIEQAARQASGPLLESLRLTDIYTGPNLGEGKRSLTLRFTFRSAAGTLKDAEVETALANIRQALTELGGDFRVG